MATTIDPEVLTPSHHPASSLYTVASTVDIRHNSIQHNKVVFHLLQTHLSWTPEQPCLVTTTSRPRRQCRSRHSIVAQNVPQIFEKCLVEVATADRGGNDVEAHEFEALRWVLELIDLARCERHRKLIDMLSTRQDFNEKVMGLVRKLRSVRLGHQDLSLLQPSVMRYKDAVQMSEFVRLSLQNMRQMWEQEARQARIDRRLSSAGSGPSSSSSSRVTMPNVTVGRHEGTQDNDFRSTAGTALLDNGHEDDEEGRMEDWFNFEEASNHSVTS
ncbi:hypothetical protein AC578_4117 [Pseudocercospora eumusae]|uniref:Uncharacterized protein n=1 Tax=Pseudocercospora eumusae TaxID=321146 RepID=A0A139HF16_9PEZI|nr:hypothetical protein AC578_4117 [Pseudocercospora eumusae]KXT01066.1 hypothetical protein AC578_4117 [Pseudocercospora eumusae]